MTTFWKDAGILVRPVTFTVLFNGASSESSVTPELPLFFADTLC